MQDLEVKDLGLVYFHRVHGEVLETFVAVLAEILATGMLGPCMIDAKGKATLAAFYSSLEIFCYLEIMIATSFCACIQVLPLHWVSLVAFHDPAFWMDKDSLDEWFLQPCPTSGANPFLTCFIIPILFLQCIIWRLCYGCHCGLFLAEGVISFLP